MLAFIEKVENQNGLVVENYNVSNATYFSIFEDEGDCFGLEIDQEKMLFLWNYISYEPQALFPSTKIEVYQDDMAAQVFGRPFNSSGQRIDPIIIGGDIKWKAANILPQHKSIIDMSMDQFFEKIKQEQHK